MDGPKFLQETCDIQVVEPPSKLEGAPVECRADIQKAEWIAAGGSLLVGMIARKCA